MGFFVGQYSAKLGRPGGDWQLLKHLGRYAVHYRKLLVLAFVLLLPLAFASAIQPVLIGQTISLIRQEPVAAFLAQRSLAQGLQFIALLLLVTVILRLSLQGIQSYLIQKVGQNITADIRQDLFNHVLVLPMTYFDRTPVGKLITRLTSDVEALGDVFATGAVGILIDIFTIIAIAVIMFMEQWILALVLLVLLIPVTGLITYFQAQFRKANYQSREELSRLNTLIQENIQGVNIVQIFGRERYNSYLFRKINQRYNREVDKTIFHDSAISATLEWIALVATAVVLIVGGWLVLGDNLTFGVLASFILFAQRLFDPLRELAEKFTLIQSGLTAVERIQEILTQPVSIRDPLVPLILPAQGGGKIHFEGVSFGYKNDELAIKNLDFTIQPGEKIALVGPTGAGKSSVIRLMCRLYEPNQGRISIDGIDIRQLAQGDLRRYVGVILQDPFLFSGDILSNIVLGESYSLEAVEAITQQLNLHEFIASLPQGYHTPVRQRGSNLSTGQKQLIAFARVAIRQPRILVLDEATASLDVGTEALIQTALQTLLQQRTAVIIAHRLSTIRRVDRIFVLKSGQLIESGSHQELLTQQGLYAHLHRMQFQGAGVG
ncbi:ABC transporter related protein [Gloeomargarita lithophora Alchichica-D10]|uniref:ABC transporter related protein n=1 Tax=Gloeomargarita lithophora Alchichica-D10 TaxID=1188229 RepID=A0A1J0AD02_9CYAN|nr:ABC transporter ATP-binding protein [Gloeomargarita lithophora]APB33813.1 ABC transporter related protein [Gloeomargarita lithophora Alchichica-D10]